MQPKIVYQDADMLVVDKPAGLLVHQASTGRPLQPTVAEWAKSVGVEQDGTDRAGIVHRLDKDTSGLLVIAKTPAAQQFLKTQFKQRRVVKTYLALVVGRLKHPAATIRLPLGRSTKTPALRSVTPGGRLAITHYRTKREVGGASLLRLQLETGRTHQIRVHLAHLGHPVVGDPLYGGVRFRPKPPRLCLHAYGLELTGPSGQKLQLKSPWPPDLEAYSQQLEAV